MSLTLVTLQDYLSEDNIEGAIILLNHQILKNPTNMSAYLNRGVLQSRINNIAQAHDDFQTALSLQPLNYLPYYNLFALSLQIGQDQKGIEWLDCCLSVAYLIRGHYQKQQRSLGKALDYCSNNYLAHVIGSYLFHQEGKHTLALSEINWAITMNPSRPELYKIRIKIYQLLGEKELIKQDLLRIKALLQIEEEPWKLKSQQYSENLHHEIRSRIEELNSFHQFINQQYRLQSQRNILWINQYRQLTLQNVFKLFGDLDMSQYDGIGVSQFGDWPEYNQLLEGSNQWRDMGWKAQVHRSHNTTKLYLIKLVQPMLQPLFHKSKTRSAIDQAQNITIILNTFTRKIIKSSNLQECCTHRYLYDVRQRKLHRSLYRPHYAIPTRVRPTHCLPRREEIACTPQRCRHHCGSCCRPHPLTQRTPHLPITHSPQRNHHFLHPPTAHPVRERLLRPKNHPHQAGSPDRPLRCHRHLLSLRHLSSSPLRSQQPQQVSSHQDLVIDINDIHNYRSLSDWEILLLAACLCSIDAGAAEEAVSPKKHPRLHALIFGEDILKDAVTIVLFRAILNLQQRHTYSSLVLLWYTPFKVLLNFLLLILGSCAIGVAAGLLATFANHKLKFIHKDGGITETSFLFLGGFLTYILAELGLCSGAISVLLYGALLNHYNTYNLSEGGRKTTNNTFGFLSVLAEGCLFLVMGIMVWQGQWATPSSDQDKMTHSYIFFAVVVVVLIIARMANIYLLAFLSRKVSPKKAIHLREQHVLFLGGLVRGAVPFALFTSVQFFDTQKYAKNEGLVLKTTIIFIIIFTNVILNSLIPMITRKLLKPLNQEAKQKLLEQSQMKEQGGLKKLGKLRDLQQKYLKPWMIRDYQIRKDQINKQKQEKKKKHLQEAMQQFEQEGNQENEMLTVSQQVQIVN